MADETKEETKTEEQVEALDLKRFLSSMRLSTEVSEPVPMIQDNLESVAEDVSDEDRFISGLAALLMNVDTTAGRFDKGMAQEVIVRIDLMVNEQINEIMHDSQFKEMESNWRSLNDLILNTNFRADVMIDILDVTKDELYEDFEIMPWILPAARFSKRSTWPNTINTAANPSAAWSGFMNSSTPPGTSSGSGPWGKLPLPATPPLSVPYHRSSSAATASRSWRRSRIWKGS